VTSAGWTADGRPLVPGTAVGEALVLDEPLSFWGGVDPTSGVIVDAHHPRRGAALGGRVLVMPAGRGSSSSSSILAECLRAGVGPLAIVIGRSDPILVLGALVATELGGPACPIVVLGDAVGPIHDGDRVEVTSSGAIRVQPAERGP
jgi:predicted aconitase with swiveling domain